MALVVVIEITKNVIVNELKDLIVIVVVVVVLLIEEVNPAHD
jgi:hypothetical protein